MGRSLKAKIKRAAHKVAKREEQLAVAKEKYGALVQEAVRKGKKLPEAKPANPLKNQKENE